MDGYDVPPDLVVDLLRSAWLVESGRAVVYERWAEHDRRFERSRQRARRRADLIAPPLEAMRGAPDHDLVDRHAAWIRSVAGDDPTDVPLGDFLVARLADWVDAHVGPLLGAPSDELKALGDEERGSLTWPERFPPVPPFEPVVAPAPEPPGEVRLRCGILGDLHIGSPGAEEAGRAAIRDLNRAHVDLVVQLGDITDHGDRDEFEHATKVLAELDAPVVTMMGNHDVFSLKEERLAGKEYYPESFGREPEGVVVEQDGWRFAVLDSIEHHATPFAPFDLVTGNFVEGPGGAVVRGALTSAQHDILADIATEGGAPTFVFLHHPPQPFTSFPPVIFGLRDVDTGRLHATVDSGNVWGVFAGHTHRNARTRDFDGVPAQEVAIPRDYPCGYALLEVTDDGYAYRFCQISDEDFVRRRYDIAGALFRRYARGSDRELAFAWTKR